MSEQQPPRHRWKCARCGREADEPIHYGFGPSWAGCSCGKSVDLVVHRELDGRVVSVEARPE